MHVKSVESETSSRWFSHTQNHFRITWCWQIITVVVAVIFLCNILPFDCAPFKIKHYSSQKSVIHRGGRPSILGSSSIQFIKRGERRLMKGSSPIHFINPFVPTLPPMQSFHSFFIPPISMGKPSMSSIYRLPLQLLNNGRPQKVFHVLPKKSPQFIDLLPHASSKIIQLPLKFVSNGKPVGIYIKEQSLNYL
ncbi:uncharacterized protein TNCV_1643851 [Trichonephila clavipes]|nr:uncharacterized protein TNCV_1643851 [Trichonephila clavipes]